MRIIVYIFITSLFIISAISAMGFKPPGESERIKAIGSTQGLPETAQRSLDPAKAFEPIPSPQPGDWLAEHPEMGQTFDDYIHAKKNRPDKARNRIYLQPLGAFPDDASPSLERLKAYASVYFAMDVQVLPFLHLKEALFTTRINPYTQKRQILTTDILDFLAKKLPGDAFCILAITMEDLYPDPSWNFVFGQASLMERVGVYSFARYDPAFYGEKRGKDYQALILRRSCKVLAHETGHMFGLAHCIFFRCVMNGSNHLQESDSRPLHLCPVCLRKLQSTIGFDFPTQYGRLLEFFKQVGFEPEALWIENRLNRILRGKIIDTDPSPFQTPPVPQGHDE